jgi:Tol biopolymer transport system component
MDNRLGRRGIATLGTLATLAAGTLVALMPSGAGAEGGAGTLGTNTVAFGSLREGNDDIYVVDIDGSGERRLTTDPAFDAAPAPSPDRRSIAFASERSGLMQVYVMAADGSGVRNLTNSETFDYYPSWFHDGSRIVFQRGTQAVGIDLWVMDADGSDQTRLTSLPANEVGASVSPDDSTIVFTGNNGGNRDVWTVPVGGGDPVNITAGTCVAGTDPCQLATDFQPAWTPEGRIVFYSDRSGEAGLWTMAADGSDSRLVIGLGQASVGSPVASPNGQWIAFLSDAFDLGGVRNVFTVRRDGTHLRRLTTTDDLLPRFAPTTR